MTEKTKAHWALLGTNIFFAVNYTAVKYLLGNGFLKPFGLNIIRVGVTAALFWLLYFFSKRKAVIEREDYARFFFCALSGIAVNQLLFIKGLSLTYSIHASLLMLITPILITFIAASLLKEPLTAYKLTGLVLGITGTLILILSREKSGHPADIFFGDMLIFLNAVAYAVYFILVKPLMKKYEPVMVLRVIFSIGFFLMLPFCFGEFGSISWPAWHVKEFFVLALIVLGGTFFAYLLNIFGLKILGASVAGAYIYSQPLFAAAIAISFLGEELSAAKVLAGLCIAAGVFLANKTRADG